MKAVETHGPDLSRDTSPHCPCHLTRPALGRNYSAHSGGVKLMFYFKYFIQIADLHFWHYQLKTWQYHLFILHSLLNRSQDSPKENIEKATLKLTSLQCWVCAIPSQVCHMHWGPSKQQSVQISQAARKNFQTGTQGCFLQQGREEVTRNHRKHFLGQSWKENRACWYQSEMLDSASAGSKGSYRVCQSTVFAF